MVTTAVLDTPITTRRVIASAQATLRDQNRNLARAWHRLSVLSARRRTRCLARR